MVSLSFRLVVSTIFALMVYDIRWSMDEDSTNCSICLVSSGFGPICLGSRWSLAVSILGMVTFVFCVENLVMSLKERILLIEILFIFLDFNITKIKLSIIFQFQMWILNYIKLYLKMVIGCSLVLFVTRGCRSTKYFSIILLRFLDLCMIYVFIIINIGCGLWKISLGVRK